MDDNKITLLVQFAMPNGKIFIGGLCTSDAEKPTENIAPNSYLFDTGNLQLSFFNGTAWG